MPMHSQTRTLPAQDRAILAAAGEAMERGTAALAQGDADGAVRWLGRAARLLPRDASIAFLLAGALAAGRHARARAAADALVRQYPGWQSARLLLARVLLAENDAAAAARELSVCLAGTAWSHGAAAADLADKIAARVGAAGWAGLGRCGTVFGRGVRGLVLDGVALRRTAAGWTLPAAWRGGRSLVASGSGVLLGDQIDIAAVVRLRGAVREADDGALLGWVAASGGEDSPPVVDVFDAARGDAVVRVAARGGPVAGMGAPPWAQLFNVPVSQLGHGAELRLFVTEASEPARPHVSQIGPGWFALAGGVLRRGAAAAQAAAEKLAGAAVPTGAATVRTGEKVASGGRGVDVVVVAPAFVPHATPAWAGALRNELPPDTKVVWCGPGAAPPGVTGIAADGGFAARVNAGLAAADAARDVVLLWPGTMLEADALPLLAAGAAADVASVSALHDGGGVAGCARPGIEAPALAAMLRVNAGLVLDLPWPDGPAIWLSRAVLAACGGLREGVFGETTGALAEFCARTRALGFRHVAACEVFASGHAGTAPPGMVVTGGAASLQPARRALDEAIWAIGRRSAAWVFVTHDEGGGVERHVQARAATVLDDGMRAVFVRPAVMPDGAAAWAISAAGSPALADLRFPAPQGVAALAALLRRDRVARVEFHHAASHDTAIETLPALLGVPYDVVLHDYAAVCPRVTLCGGNGKYCGEPADPRDCQDCIDDFGPRMPGAGDIVAWRARSEALLAGAARVIVPSGDAARRMTRHFPDMAPIVSGWDEAAAAAAPRTVRRSRAAAVQVATLGALTRDKGFDVLLACARDAARRRLALRFTLVGHSVGDDRLMATGVMFVTGPFAEGEAASLLAEADADVALLPSVWPETWSYALDELWRAGLPVVAFDLGAPAERIRAGGRGRLLPAGLPAGRVNDALLGYTGKEGLLF
jgi:glycosyltransferase involved in cell wall biosynthesis